MANEYASIPEPTTDSQSLLASVSALKQTVEALIGQRGTSASTVVTQADLAAQSNLAGVTPSVARQNLGGLREVLSATKNYYADVVAGSDSNDGLAPASAHKTIQHAIDTAAAAVDTGSWAINISCADGTYPENITLPSYLTSGKLAQATAIIQGNASTHSSVLIQPASGVAVQAVGVSQWWTLKNLKIKAPGAVAIVSDLSKIALDGVVLDNALIQAQAQNAGAVVEFINNPYVAQGTVLVHVNAVNGGTVLWQASATCTFGTGLSVGTALLQASADGSLDLSAAGIFNGLTATGAGSKFFLNYGGILRTSNDAEPNNVLPSGLTDGTFNLWSVQAGTSYANAVATTQATLDIVGRTTHGDADVTLTVTDVPFVQLAAALTAIRTWTLPLANAAPAGTQLTINDAGGINGANTLKVQRQGANAFTGNGVAANSITLSVVGASITVRNDGASGWYLVAKI